MNIQPLIDRWQTDEGKPYKGTLIDMDAYYADPSNPGCMCAQGQVLHYAGWDADRLDNVPQDEADREVAKLLNISISHAVLLRIVNDRADGAPAVVLTDPGAVLGGQWSKVLDFWWHLDTMTGAAWESRTSSAWAAAGAAAWKPHEKPQGKPQGSSRMGQPHWKPHGQPHGQPQGKPHRKPHGKSKARKSCAATASRFTSCRSSALPHRTIFPPALPTMAPSQENDK
jgi:hypothetical protein